jgi:DNA-directed RNA polymerase specialized sigma24 family protein
LHIAKTALRAGAKVLWIDNIVLVREVRFALGVTADTYGEAYRTGFDRTVRFLLSRGAGCDPAVEAAQAAWVRGWERLHQLRDDKMLLTWVNTIALNVYRGLWRKERLSVPLLERHSEFEIDLAPIDLQTVLRLCRRRERALLEQQIQGISVEEIAGQKGVSSTAIRIRLMRARRSARERIEKRRLQRLRRTCVAAELGASESGLRVA